MATAWDKTVSVKEGAVFLDLPVFREAGGCSGPGCGSRKVRWCQRIIIIIIIITIIIIIIIIIITAVVQCNAGETKDHNQQQQNT